MGLIRRVCNLSPPAGYCLLNTMLANFSDIYSEYAPHVQRFAWYLCRDPHLAEELTSETFARAFPAADRERPGSLKSYLFTIVRHLWYDEARRRSRHVELDETRHDPRSSQETAAGQRQRLARVMLALRGFSECDQTLLLLRAAGEMSYEEIAAETGISVAAAKVRVHRARRRLAALVPE